ncbi:hypothetical protein AAY473_025900 [Plecturocebus cupreus]
MVLGPTSRAANHILPESREKAGTQARGASAGPARPETERVALCELPLSIPPRTPPLPPGARVPAGEGAGERRAAQESGSAAASDVGVARGAAAHGLQRPSTAATAAPSSSSSSRASSRDAANAPAPQALLPSASRPRTEPPPAPPRAQQGQRQPAPPSARPRGRRRPPSRLLGASPAVTQAAVPGNFLPCRDHPAPRTRQRGLPPAAARGFLQDL